MLQLIIVNSLMIHDNAVGSYQTVQKVEWGFGGRMVVALRLDPGGKVAYCQYFVSITRRLYM